MKILLTFVICLTILFSQAYAAKIAVLTLAIGEKYEKAVALGIKNKRHYCSLHGYDFIYSNRSLDSSRHPAWSKILLIKKVIDQGKYDWVFWTDADSLITNHTIKLESLIDKNYAIILNGEGNDVCSGQVLIKNCKWSIDFLNRVYNHKEFINHPIWENAAFNFEYANNIKKANERIKLIEQRKINSFAPEVLAKVFGVLGNDKICFQPGDFIIHFAGCGINGLEELMNHYSQFIIYK